MQPNHSILLEETLPATDHFFNMMTGMLARDEASLAELYDATLPKVYGLALKITRNHHLAEEVVEDTYMQAWQEIAKFDHTRGPMIAWLMVICRSRAIDELRRMDETQTQVSPEHLMDEMDSGNTPLDILLMLERESTIHFAMLDLNAIQRQLISLAFFKGYTHDEISKQMRMPLGSVKSTIKRAQDKLKIVLNKAGVAL